MLKITVLDGGAEQTLMVEGKLAEPWVSELKCAWVQARQGGQGSRILIDLSGMTSIDPRGEAELMAMICDGARLTAKGLYCEYVVQQLVKKVRARRDRHNGPGAKDSSSAKESSRADQQSSGKENQ